MNKKKFDLFISLLIGLFVFAIIFLKFGMESILLIINNISLKYLLVFLFFFSASFLPLVLKWQIILRTYKKKINFLELLKQTIAGYAVSYITPVAKLGGEPVRAYMLKKNCNVDLKTGSSSIVIDKFIELLGMIFFGLIGMIFIISFPKIPFYFKSVFISLIILGSYILFIFYYRTKTEKGSFSSLLVSFKIYRNKKFIKSVENVEKKMSHFFKNHKKEFFLSFLCYIIYGIIVFFEFKFLFLSFGVHTSIIELMLSLTIFGLFNLFPIPAGIGFGEAGQSSLFLLLKGNGSIGLAFVLLERITSLVVVAIGFSIISYFAGKHIGFNIPRKIRDKL